MNTSYRIAVCSRSFSQHPILRKEISQKYKNIKFNDEGVSLKEDSLIDFLDQCDGAVIGLEKIDERVLSKCPKLKFIGKVGVGLDLLDLQAMDKFGVTLGWTPGVNSQNVAELTLALALNLLKRIPTSNAMAKAGEWKQVKGKQLSSLTYGILGCGHVGRALVNLLKPFGTKIIVHDIINDEQYLSSHNIKNLPLEKLFSSADMLSIHVQKNEKTLGIINRERINMMKNGSFLINTCRGGLVDESAVVSALDSGKLDGAAFDTLEIEPPSNFELINHPKILVTTHIGGSSEEAILSMGRAAIKGLEVNFPATSFTKYI